MLLFKQYVGNGQYISYPIVLTNENRTRVGNMFNFISERMETFRKKLIHYEAVFKMLGHDGKDLVPDGKLRKLIFDAMGNASNICTNGGDSAEVTGFVNDGYPWIRFVALNYREREDNLPDEWMEFIKDMVNKDEISELLITKNYEPDTVLVCLPLPLHSFVGKLLTRVEFEEIDTIVSRLAEIKREVSGESQHREVGGILCNSVLPIETMYSQSLVLIARDDINFSLVLS